VSVYGGGLLSIVALGRMAVCNDEVSDIVLLWLAGISGVALVGLAWAGACSTW